MKPYKGRQLGFLTILCAGWAAARVTILFLEPRGQVENANHLVAPRIAASATNVAIVPGTATMDASIAPEAACCALSVRQQVATLAKSGIRSKTNAQVLAIVVQEHNQKRENEIPYPPEKVAIVSANTSTPFIPDPLGIEPRRMLDIEAYAYSFWRAKSGNGGLAAAGQYGGSQSGFIATLALKHGNNRSKAQRLALLVRAAVAHDDLGEREIAIGLRYRPISKLPLTITGERRFQNGRGDAFAGYIAGGAQDIILPQRFRLEGFGQAGVVSGKEAGPFFDGFARADRQLLHRSSASVHAGGAIWGGGQRDATRLDIGPSIRANINIKQTRLRMTADWRFRIAGVAMPKDGPAITLSTGF